MPQSSISLDNKFSFDHLSSTQFEEFCFDLLARLDFKNIIWRKGTGHTSSPSDQGRDIECIRINKDIDGEISIEKWFIECKHYKSGVPTEKIQGVLSWANSKRPDKVLIIASNFLSNQCKNYLDEYVHENRPPFKIKYWELKNLEEVTKGQLQLLEKYNIGFNFSFIKNMHPNHLLYIKEIHYLSFDCFFKIMDDVEAAKRDKILFFAYSVINGHKIRDPTKTHIPVLYSSIKGEKNGSSYGNFKSRCYELENNKNISIANYIVDIILKSCYIVGDITTLEQKIKKYESLKETFQDELNNGKEIQINQSEQNIINMLDEKDPQVKKIQDETEEYHLLYNFFCEDILPSLFLEEKREISPINLDLITDILKVAKFIMPLFNNLLF